MPGSLEASRSDGAGWSPTHPSSNSSVDRPRRDLAGYVLEIAEPLPGYPGWRLGSASAGGPGETGVEDPHVTDARYPEAWLNDRRVVRLSDAAHRLFVTANAWSASNRTDGFLEVADLALIHGVDPRHQTELVAAGLWTVAVGGLQIMDFHKTQTTKTQLDGLDHKRHQDRERKARERARKRGEPEPDPDDQAHLSRVTSGVTSDVTQRLGQAGQAGQALRQGTNSGGRVDDPRFWKQPQEMAAETVRADCLVCGSPLNAALACQGETTHPSCAA